jgi:hypothetical protein
MIRLGHSLLSSLRGLIDFFLLQIDANDASKGVGGFRIVLEKFPVFGNGGTERTVTVKQERLSQPISANWSRRNGAAGGRRGHTSAACGRRWFGRIAHGRRN